MKKKWILSVSLVFICVMLSMVSVFASTKDGNVVTCIDFGYLSDNGSFPAANNLQQTGNTFHGNSGLFIRGWIASGNGWGQITAVNLVLHKNGAAVAAWGVNSLTSTSGTDYNAIVADARVRGLSSVDAVRRFEFRISNFDAYFWDGKIKMNEEYSFHIDVHTQAAGVRISDSVFKAGSGNDYNSFFVTYRPKFVNSVALKLGGVNYNASNIHFNEINKKIRVEGWASTTEGQIFKTHLVIFKDGKELRRINVGTNMSPGDADGIMGHAFKGQNGIRIDHTYAWNSGEGTELVPGAEYQVFVDFWYRSTDGKAGEKVYRSTWQDVNHVYYGGTASAKTDGWFLKYDRPLNWMLDTSTDFYLDEWGKRANDNGIGGSTLADGTIQWAGWALSRSGYKLSGLEVRFTRYEDLNGDGDYNDRNEEAWDTGWLDTTSNPLFYEPGAAQTQSIGTGVAGGWVNVHYCKGCGYSDNHLGKNNPPNMPAFKVSGTNLICPSCNKTQTAAETLTDMQVVHSRNGWTIEWDYKHRFRVRINPYRLISTYNMGNYTNSDYAFATYFKFTFTDASGSKHTYGTLMGDINARLVRINHIRHSFFNGEPAIGPDYAGRDHWFMYPRYYIKDTGHFLIKKEIPNTNTNGRPHWTWTVNTMWDGTGQDVTNDARYKNYVYEADGKTKKVWNFDSWPNGGVYSATLLYPVVHTNNVYIETGFRTNAYNPKYHDSITDPKILETIKAHEDRTHYEKAFSNPAAHHGVTQAVVDEAMSKEAQERIKYLANRSNLTGVKRIQCTWDSRAFDSYFGDLYDVGMYHDADWGKRSMNMLYKTEVLKGNVAGDSFYGRFLSGISGAGAEMHTLQEQGGFETRSAFEGDISAIDLADGPHMFRFTFTEDWGEGHLRTVPGNQNRIYVVHKEEDYILDIGEVGSSPFGDDKIWRVDENGQWSVDVWRAWRLADESKPMQERALSYYIEKIHVRNYYYKDDNTGEKRRTHVLTDDYNRIVALYGAQSNGTEFYDHPQNLAWKVPYNTSTFYIKRPILPSETKEAYSKVEDRLSSHGTDPDANNQETHFSYIVPSELLSEEIPSGTKFSARVSYLAYGKDDRIFSDTDPNKGKYGILRRGTLTLRFTVNHDFELKVDTASSDPALNQPFEGWFQYVELTIRNNKHIHYNKYGYDIALPAQKADKEYATKYAQTTDVKIWEAVNGVYADQPKFEEELSFDGGGFNTTTKKPDNSIAAIPSVWRRDYDPKNPNSPGNHEGVKLTYEPNPDPNLEAEHTVRFVVNNDLKSKETNATNNVVEKTFKARTFYEFKLGKDFDGSVINNGVVSVEPGQDFRAQDGTIIKDVNGDGVRDTEDIYEMNKAPQLMGDLNGDGTKDSVFIHAAETGNGYLHLDFYTRNGVTYEVAKAWLKNGKTTTFTVPLSIYVTQGEETYELYKNGYYQFAGTNNAEFVNAPNGTLHAGTELTFAPNQVRHHQMLLKMPNGFVNSGEPFTLRVVLNEKATTANKGKNYEHEVIPENNTEIEHMGYDFSVTMGTPQVTNAGSLTSDAYGYVYQAGPNESIKIPFTITNKDQRGYNVTYEIIQVETDAAGNLSAYDPLTTPGYVVKKETIYLAANSSKSLSHAIQKANLIHQGGYLIRVNYGNKHSLYGCYNAQRERNSKDNYTQYVRILVGRNSNFWIEPIIPTDLATGKRASYMAGETVISAFRIYSGAGFDLEKAEVVLEVFRNGSVGKKLTKIYPLKNNPYDKPGDVPTGTKADCNIAYFKWTVPTGWVGSNIECRATVQAEELKYFDEDKSDNTASFNVSVVKKMSDTGLTPEDTEYAANKSKLDLTGSAPEAKQGKASWTEYEFEWEDAEHTTYKWVTKNYNIKLDVDVTLGAQTGASNYVENGKVYMRSGYAFSQTMQYTPSQSISGDRYVEPQVAYSLFPEFAYSKQAEYSGLFEDIYALYHLKNFRVLESDGTRTFKFKNNADATNATNKRVHFIPLAFPDGEYEIFTKLSRAWTPEGMLSTSTVETINIKGAMYDDYSVGRKSQSKN